MADEKQHGKPGFVLRIADAGLLVLIGGLLFNAGIQYQRINQLESLVDKNTTIAQAVRSEMPINLQQVPAELAAIKTQLSEVNKRLDYLTRRIDEEAARH